MKEAARWLSIIRASHSTSHSMILWDNKNSSMTQTTPWAWTVSNHTRLARDSTSPDSSVKPRRDQEALVNARELLEEDFPRHVVPAAKCENIEVRAGLTCTG